MPTVKSTLLINDGGVPVSSQMKRRRKLPRRGHDLIQPTRRVHVRTGWSVSQFRWCGWSVSPALTVRFGQSNWKSGRNWGLLPRRPAAARSVCSSAHKHLSCLLSRSAAGDHAEPRLERWPCCARCHLGCAHNIEESQITAPEGDGGLCVAERAGVCVTARNCLFYSRTSQLPPSRSLSMGPPAPSAEPLRTAGTTGMAAHANANKSRENVQD